MECGMLKNSALFECIPWFLPKGYDNNQLLNNPNQSNSKQILKYRSNIFQMSNLPNSCIA